MQFITVPFQGALTGPLLPYTPFDGATGLLREAHITVSGTLTGMFIVADPGANPLVPVPYRFQIEQYLEPSSNSIGFGFNPSGVPALLDFMGFATPLTPFQAERFVRYEFRLTSASAPGVYPTLLSVGVDLPPATMAARLEHFINTRCNDTDTYQSGISINVTHLSAFLTLFTPLNFTGQTQLEYSYFTTDQLTDHIRNGDFETASMSPWGAGGAGAARLASPIECLVSTLNQLLELEAGSPVNVSQMIDTPGAPFELLFSYGFAQAEGQLEVWLGGMLLEQIDATTLPPPGFRTRVLAVSDPVLLGRSAIPLSFVWNAAAGSVAWLDDVHLYAVPEPEAGTVEAASLLSLIAIARLRRSRDVASNRIGALPSTSRTVPNAT